MAKPKGRRALGRGLDALLPPKASPAAGPQAASEQASAGYGRDAVFNCPIERIRPRRDQPRQHFDGDALDELATTIATPSGRARLPVTSVVRK